MIAVSLEYSDRMLLPQIFISWKPETPKSMLQVMLKQKYFERKYRLLPNLKMVDISLWHFNMLLSW